MEKTRKGLLMNYDYDASGRVSRTVYPDKHVSTHKYDYVNAPQAPFTKAYFVEFEEDFGLNYFLELHFDAQKQKVYEEIRNSGDWLSLSYTYNSMEQKKTQTDKAGNVTTYVYNANGDILTETIDQVTGPDLVTSRTYNGDYALLTETDPYGNTTVYTYETSGEKRLLTKSITVNGQTTTESYDYTPDGAGFHTLTTTDPNNKTTITKLDSTDKMRSISRNVSGLWNNVAAMQNTYEYNDMEQLKAIGHNGFFYTFTYDTDGNIATIKVSDSIESGNEQLLLTKSKTENGDGETTNTDAFANSQSVSVVSDRLGRTKAIQYNGTARYSFAYTSDGQGPDDFDGDEVTIITDLASGRKTVDKKSDDGDSFNQSIVVTDQTTLAQLYSIGIVNEETAITLTTNIASAEQTYVYSKDTRGRLYQTSYTLPDTTSVQKTDAFSDYGHVTGSTLLINGVNRIQQGYNYRPIPGVGFSNQVETETIQTGASSTSYGYSYDKLGNITKITKTDGGVTSDLYRYVYDEASQLIREDNTVTNQTTIWQYDKGGNIKNKKIYALTAAGVNPDGNSTLIDDIPYEYGAGLWKDQLTSYDGQSIVNDASGNPTSYLGATLTWTMGRQLAHYSKPGLTLEYTYNEQGIRTSKTVNGVRTDYYLDGSQVIAEVTGSNRTDYRYDANGHLVAMRYNGMEYYYVMNIQGDIIGLIDNDGNTVVRYTYDAWGNLTSCTESLASTLGQDNPFRYRSFQIDKETNLYYLESRYFDPETSKFINSDMVDLLEYQSNSNYANNLFAYGNNNPISFLDPKGYWPLDMFTTSDNAAIDFVKCYNVWTQLMSKERGAYIYKISYIKYYRTYTRYYYPNSIIGQHANVVLGFISGYLLPKIYSAIIIKTELFAWVHTHPLCDCHLGNQFSQEDIATTFLPYIRYCYVGIPYGYCLRVGPYGSDLRCVAVYLPTTYYWPAYYA